MQPSESQIRLYETSTRYSTASDWNGSHFIEESPSESSTNRCVSVTGGLTAVTLPASINPGVTKLFVDDANEITSTWVYATATTTIGTPSIDATRGDDGQLLNRVFLKDLFGNSFRDLSGNVVFGLLQRSSGSVNGDVSDGSNLQISFVTESFDGTLTLSSLDPTRNLAACFSLPVIRRVSNKPTITRPFHFFLDQPESRELHFFDNGNGNATWLGLDSNQSTTQTIPYQFERNLDGSVSYWWLKAIKYRSQNGLTAGDQVDVSIYYGPATATGNVTTADTLLVAASNLDANSYYNSQDGRRWAWLPVDKSLIVSSEDVIAVRQDLTGGGTLTDGSVLIAWEKALPPSLAIATPSFPATATVGDVVSITNGTASGVASPFTYAISSGALPATLSLNTATGEISGTLTAAGSGSFVVTVTDANGDTASSQTVSWDVDAALAISDPAFATVNTVGTALAGQTDPVASGGESPYTYSVADGALPLGITLDANTGALSGTPTAAQTGSLSILATDADGRTAESNLATYDIDDPLTIADPTLPTLTVGDTISITDGIGSGGEIPGLNMFDPTMPFPFSVGDVVSITDGVAINGAAAFTYSVQSGTLPSGLSLNTATGEISGTLTTAETGSFVIRVTDANTDTADTETINFTVT